MVGTEKLSLSLALVPHTSHLVKLSLPNIFLIMTSFFTLTWDQCATILFSTVTYVSKLTFIALIFHLKWKEINLFTETKFMNISVQYWQEALTQNREQWQLDILPSLYLCVNWSYVSCLSYSMWKGCDLLPMKYLAPVHYLLFCTKCSSRKRRRT